MRTSTCVSFALLLLTGPASTHAQWMQTPGPYGGYIQSLFANGSAVYTSISFREELGRGLYRSTSGGNVWSRSDMGLPDVIINCLAATESGLFAGTGGGGVYSSTDHGATWYATGMTNSYIYFLVATGSCLYTITATGFSRSTDNGQTWSPFDTLWGYHPRALVISGTNLVMAPDTGGVICSTDSGASWFAGGLQGMPVYALASDGLNLFAASLGSAVYRSTDRGITWTPANAGLSGVWQPALIHDGTNLFLGTTGAIYRSADEGQSWSKMKSLPKGTFCPCFTITGRTLYAGTSTDGVLRSTDEGTTWMPANTGLSNVGEQCLAVGDSILFSGMGVAPLFRSTDNGITWAEADSGLPGRDGVILPADGFLFAGTDYGMYRSSNLGVSWDSINTGFDPINMMFARLATNGTTIYAGTHTDPTGGIHGGLYRSTDAGGHWVKILGFGGETWIPGIFAHESLLLAWTIFGLDRSTNQGDTWAPADSGMGLEYREVGSTFARITTKIFTVVEGRLYRSTDQGLSWGRVGTSASFGELGIFPATGNTLFNVNESGIQFSNDFGASWTSFNSGLSDSTLYACTANSKFFFVNGKNGLWRRPISDFVTSIAVHEHPVNEFRLNQNYPNPFNPSTTIRYALPSRAQVTLTVFNTLGQHVATLVNEIQDPGYHDVRFDGSGLASGVYFYRLQAGDVVQSKKLIVLR